MWRNICNQCRLLAESWNVLIVFITINILVLINYVTNVNLYQGRDVVVMYHPMRLLTLTQDSATGLLLVELVPILCVLACGFSYIKAKNTGAEVFELSRCGATQYYTSKIIAVFIVTMVIFTFPMFMEMVLNALSFPLNATGDLSNQTAYTETSNEMIREYLFWEIYKISTYLYPIVGIFMFGVWMGVLAAFVVALSFLPFVKARLILFLPLYIIVSLIPFLGYLCNGTTETFYGFYLFMYEAGNLNRVGYYLMLFGFVAVTGMILHWKCKGDCVSR